MSTKKKKILFVIKPGSNKAFSEKELREIIHQVISIDKFDWEIYHTTGKQDQEKLNNHINTSEPEIIISVGGDGTANMVASTIIHKKIRMGIIPTGSANGLAYNLKMPNNFKDALERIIHASAKPVDLIEINNKYYCLHLSDIGINARIVKRFSKEKDNGLAGYGKQLIKELSSPKTSFKFTVKTPNYHEKRKAEMLVISNAPAYGTGAIINPKGILDDGKFEIVIIKPYPWWIMFRFIAAFFSGSLHKMEYVKIISTSKAEITLYTPQDFHIDGEVQKPVKGLDVNIVPGAIEMLY